MHSFTRAKLLLTIILLALTPVVMAQTKIGIIKGVVTDTAGRKGLASATINVLDEKDSSLVSFGRSKDNGSFEITKLDAGKYLLLVSYTGFNKIQKSFAISAEKPLHDF